MKHRIRVSLFVIIICFAALFSVGPAYAQDAKPEQKQKPGLYIWSRTDVTGVKDEELASVYQEADASLMEQVRDGLESREIKVTVVKSEQNTAADPTRFILVIKVEKIELGGKRPFGRTAKVKVSCSFQNKDRFDLVRRSIEETSVQKWQNCIKKISEQVVHDAADDLAKYAAKNADDKQGASKPAPTTKQEPTAQQEPAKQESAKQEPAKQEPAMQEPAKQEPAGSSTETRLKDLENLKAKGLITEKEYKAKRKEILKGL